MKTHLRYPILERDMPAMVKLLRDFLAMTPYGALFPPPEGYHEVLIQHVLDQGGVIILACDEDERPVGAIAGVMTRHILTSQPYCDEVMWFVEPEARPTGCGLQLLVALEGFATSNGATLLRMAAPAESPVGKLLERNGYVRLETSFMKMLARPTVQEAVSIPAAPE